MVSQILSNFRGLGHARFHSPQPLNGKKELTCQEPTKCPVRAVVGGGCLISDQLTVAKFLMGHISKVVLAVTLVSPSHGSAYRHHQLT